MKRRSLLSTAFLASVPLTGCLNDAIAINVTARNFTDEAVEFQLRMFSVDDELIDKYADTFQAHRSYELPTLKRSIDHFEISVAGSTVNYTSTRDYKPTFFNDPCEEKRLDFKVNSEHIDLDYLCPDKQM